MAPKIITRLFRYFMLERPARGKDFPTFQQELEQASLGVANRISNAADTERNRQQARHIIGIERWAQQRLRHALGVPLEMDEHDGYQPDPELDMDALRDAFLDARHNTLVLAAEMHDEGVDPTTTVPHNDYGDVTVGGWFQYIKGHANLEAKRLKAG